MINIEFIHVGYHKCASTTVQQLFRQHPDIAYTRDIRTVLNPDFDLEQANWLKTEGGAPKVYAVSSETLCNVDYTAMDPFPPFFTVQKQLHDRWPEAKIFIIIRKQLNIIRSYYTESILKFATTMKFKKFFEKALAAEYFFYDRMIERYIEHFGRDKVMALPLEMLKSDPKGFVAGLSSHAGVDLSGCEIPQANPGGSHLANEIIRRLNHLYRLKGDQRPIHVKKRRTRARIDRLVGRIPFSFHTPEMEKSCADLYRQSNERTSSLIGLDLVGDYGY